MTTLRQEAMEAYERRQRERKLREIEARQEMCAAAVAMAGRSFGRVPERVAWDDTLGCPVVSYDGGDVRLAWKWDDGVRVFLVVFECERCGGPLPAWPEVRDLAELGSRLADGCIGECYEGHYCVKREEEAA